MMADVLLTPKAQTEFDALPLVVKERVRALFRRLANWPAVSGAKPLVGNLAGSFRLRTGAHPKSHSRSNPGAHPHWGGSFLTGFRREPHGKISDKT